MDNKDLYVKYLEQENEHIRACLESKQEPFRAHLNKIIEDNAKERRDMRDDLSKLLNAFYQTINSLEDWDSVLIINMAEKYNVTLYEYD